MVLVLETLERPNEVELVRIFLTKAGQDGDLDLALPRVRRVVFQDFDSDNVAGTLLPAFYHLPKGTPAEKFEHLVLGGQRVEHLVLHQLVISVGSTTGSLAGGLRVGMTSSRCNL